MLSIASRAHDFLPVLIGQLSSQANGKPVELLVLLDNQVASIGEKRNALTSLAQGEYVAFVDDDDHVADDYVEALLDAIERNPGIDCVVFDAWVTQDGAYGRPCRYGVEFEDEDRADVYLRRPNHLCCVRAAIAKSVRFELVSWHEDFHWAAAVAPRLQTQARIEQVLYYYDYRSATSASASPEGEGAAVQSQRPDLTRGPSVQSRDVDALPAMHHQTADLPIYGFIHVAMMNHWRRVVEEQLLKLRASGLWERTERIFVGLLGPRRDDFDFEDGKLEVIYYSPDVEEAEFPTLAFLQEFCRDQECLAYYLHTKGVFRASPQTDDWRRLMEHFAIYRHQDCLHALAEHDACGVNWSRAALGPHFSGNFWWARSSYINSLPSIASFGVDSAGRRNRHDCERWIGMNPNGRLLSLHQSKVNHYHSLYPRAHYAQVREVKGLAALNAPSAWQGLERRFQDLLEGIEPIETIVEIGVEYGYSLFSFSAALPQATVIGVDPYQGTALGHSASQIAVDFRHGVIGGDAAEAWVRRFLPQFPRTMLLRAKSDEIARAFVGKIDVLHIDAIHGYQNVRADFEAWEPHVRSGGCVLFHDTRSFPEDVGRFFRELPGRKAEIVEHHGLGAWYKPQRPTKQLFRPAVRIDRVDRDAFAVAAG